MSRTQSGGNMSSIGSSLSGELLVDLGAFIGSSLSNREFFNWGASMSWSRSVTSQALLDF